MPNILWHTEGYIVIPYDYRFISNNTKYVAGRKVSTRKKRAYQLLVYVSQCVSASYPSKNYLLVERKKLAYVLGLNRDLKKDEKTKINTKIKEAIDDMSDIITSYETYINLLDLDGLFTLVKIQI